MNNKSSIAAKQRIISYIRSGKISDARKACEKICRLQPDDPIAWSLLGSVEENSSDLEKAAAAYHRAISLRPDYFEALYNLGCVYINTGNQDEALKCFRQAHKINPDSPEVNNNIGTILRKQGDIENAKEYFRCAIKTQPRQPMFWYNLGNALYTQGQLEEAMACYSKAVMINPDYFDAFYNMGNACRQLFLRDQAAKYYQEALRIQPKHAGVSLALADILVLLGQHDGAIQHLDNILETDAGNLEALSSKAAALERQGCLKQAFNLIRRLAESRPACTKLAITYANLCEHFDVCDAALSWLDLLLSAHDIPLDEAVILHQAKGKILDKRKEFKAAFNHFHQANLLKIEQGGESRHNEDIDASLAFFNIEEIASLPRSSVISDLPVFIVGMPRSGTSLVEQIIASHSEAHGGGELPHINRIISSLPNFLHTDTKYPECLRNITNEQIDALTNEYLAYLKGLSSSARRITDKLPHNFMWLGMIELMFPAARIIHCTRDPMDNCLSLYTTRGLNAHHSYAFDLEALGDHYNKYLKLMDRWKDLLKIPILTISYEKLIDDFDTEARRLIEFCGLEWDEQCLRFYDSGRITTTLSYDQVRRPIYKESVGRWKNYREFLTPLEDALGKGMSG